MTKNKTKILPSEQTVLSDILFIKGMVIIP